MGSTELESVTSSVSGRRANQTALTAQSKRTSLIGKRCSSIDEKYYARFLAFVNGSDRFFSKYFRTAGWHRTKRGETQVNPRQQSWNERALYVVDSRFPSRNPTRATASLPVLERLYSLDTPKFRCPCQPS